MSAHLAMHIQDGWYADRLTDGGVLIRKVNSDGTESERLRMTAEGWASVVASVSVGGEEGGRYYLARAFHTGEPVGCNCLHPAPNDHGYDCTLGLGT